MSYPVHPDTVILKNKYYPKGLSELDVWKYYQKIKYPIVRFLNNRTVFFEISTDLNKTIIRRKGTDGKTFYLNTLTYDKFITGRTLVIHGVMNEIENFGIIDIDVDNLDLAKDATYDVYEFVRKGNINFVESVNIRFTGKTSFHIICNFRRRKNINITRQLFRKLLLDSDLSRKYTIESRRRKGIPNLDISSNKINGGFISLYSLSSIGLPCTEINPNLLENFKPEQLIIKK